MARIKKKLKGLKKKRTPAQIRAAKENLKKARAAKKRGGRKRGRTKLLKLGGRVTVKGFGGKKLTGRYDPII